MIILNKLLLYTPCTHIVPFPVVDVDIGRKQHRTAAVIKSKHHLAVLEVGKLSVDLSRIGKVEQEAVESARSHVQWYGTPEMYRNKNGIGYKALLQK